jgi:alpha-mannosidase
MRIRSSVVAILVIAGAALSSSASLADTAGEVKRIYIANDDHTDYFWTGDDEDYRAAFQAMLDYYMDQAEATASNPPDARGRFNCDGSLWLWEYERNRPAADYARLITHLRNETITMPLQTAVLLFGAMPAEAVLRNMYYAGRIERREALRFPLVVAMENQTLPAGVASLWAGSGARYSWKGVCGCASRTDWGDRPREIYHFVGPDGQSVCMKWNTQIQSSMHIGGYAEARFPFSIVNFMDNDATFTDRWPWPVSAAFGYGHDPLQTFTDEFIDASLQLSDAGRRVIVSNEVDFFEDFLANHGDEIPTFDESFGNEWDLLTASLAEVTAGFKRSVENLRTAEALATIATILDGSFLNGRAAARDLAFQACGLYYEHDWTADGPVGMDAREQFQRDMLSNLKTYVDDLHDDGLAALASHVRNTTTSERHVVFNPLSWSRTDFADLAVTTALPVHVVEVESGLEIPSQLVSVGGQNRIRILAKDVPSVGYRVYEVRPGPGTTFESSAIVTLPSFENGLYKVTMGSRGQITSLVEKVTAQQWVSGAIHDIGGGSGSVVVENTGPVSTTLRVSTSTGPRHDTRVTLFTEEIDRIAIEGHVTQNFSSAVHYRYGFDVPGAIVRHEEVGMIAVAKRAADGGDYADENARTDYLTFNHFVDIATPSRGIVLSNWDSPFFRLGNSTPSFLDATSSTIDAVVGMQVDGPSLGIANQGGDTSFLNRYAIRTHGFYHGPSVMKFALEHQNPFVAAKVTGGAIGVLPGDRWSLVTLPSSDVILWSLKVAEEGLTSGMIARVWNLSEFPSSFTLSFPDLHLTSAKRTSHIETDTGNQPLTDGALTDSALRQQLKTYRVKFSGALPVGDAGTGTPQLLLSVHPQPAPVSAPATVAFELPSPGVARVAVYDAAGREVVRLHEGRLEAGRHELAWTRKPGHDVQPGVYFVRLSVGGHEVGRARIVRVR